MRASPPAIWLSRHLQVFFDTLGRLWQSPIASAMTTLVIAIAISLPLVLFQIVTSIDALTRGWSTAPQISVFLKGRVQGVDVDPVESGQTLLENPMVEDVQYVSPEQGLNEFEEITGFRQAIEALPENPLPPLLIVFPATGDDSAASTELARQMMELPFVDTAVYDQEWLVRIGAIVDAVRRGVIILAVLMCAGILMVISNTVRLGITNRASEIEIIDQVGGTGAFIRRPFLYTGALQCLLGVLAAWVISNITIALLARPISRLAGLYQSEFNFGLIGPMPVLTVALVTTVLGVLVSRITVDRYLHNLRPE